jgi:hypothetical protein
MEKAYLSNGCRHCDAIMGHFYTGMAEGEQRDIASVEIVIDDVWYRAIRRYRHHRNGWCVYTS